MDYSLMKPGEVIETDEQRITRSVAGWTIEPLVQPEPVFDKVDNLLAVLVAKGILTSDQLTTVTDISQEKIDAAADVLGVVVANEREVVK